MDNSQMGSPRSGHWAGWETEARLMLNLALTLNGTRPACATERFPKPQIPLSSAMMRAHAISLIRTSGGEQFKEDSRLILVPSRLRDEKDLHGHRDHGYAQSHMPPLLYSYSDAFLHGSLVESIFNWLFSLTDIPRPKPKLRASHRDEVPTPQPGSNCKLPLWDYSKSLSLSPEIIRTLITEVPEVNTSVFAGDRAQDQKASVIQYSCLGGKHKTDGRCYPYSVAQLVINGCGISSQAPSGITGFLLRGHKEANFSSIGGSKKRTRDSDFPRRMTHPDRLSCRAHGTAWHCLVGYIAPEIFGMLLHKRTQALPHPENSNANLSPQSPREQKNHFYSFVIGPGKRRGDGGGAVKGFGASEKKTTGCGFHEEKEGWKEVAHCMKSSEAVDSQTGKNRELTEEICRI
ncbi:hypothetical protein BGY98DRAFT_1166407 [Russula aff. rugulosa BPL654]|nr:hypothetical protein BGY98DRAFT_1166407 [Russula aff. rugulosa BPL654]